MPPFMYTPSNRRKIVDMKASFLLFCITVVHWSLIVTGYRGAERMKLEIWSRYEK